MKKLVFPLLLTCCTGYAKDNVTIHGHITNPLADSITVSPSLSSVPYKRNDHVAILHNGEFTLEFNVPDGFTQVRIVHGNQETELFVQPGADLTLTLDANNFDSTLHYAGKGKELANFIAKHVLEVPTMQKIEIKGQMLCDKEPAEFETELKKLENREIDFLQKYGEDLPTGFADYFKAAQRYNVYSVMAKYPQFHEMMKQKSMSVKSVPKENYVVINDIPEEFNDAYINMPSYTSYIVNIFSLQISKARAEDNITAENAFPADTTLTLAYKRMPPITAEYYVANRIYQDTKYRPIDIVEHEYDVYKKHFPKSRYLENIQKAISFKKTIANGKPEIDFDIVTPEGRKMKLSDLKGNVVYIDFWSAGCVPCLAEMPDSKKVRAYFKDKPVSFVYISLDADDSVWKEAIKRYGVEGINMHTDMAYESAIVTKYGVYGIPSYFLVDKKGKFADADNLARPGNTEKLIVQIEKLLE